MAEPLELLGRYRVLPVAVLDREQTAVPLARTLAEGGLPCLEVTLRTPAALGAIRLLADLPGLLVGAGTVRSPAQAEQAIRAGARFVVSPGFSAAVVARCREAGVPVLPGVATATEVQQALQAGVTTVKLFPADLLGGPAAVRALAGPFPEMRFVPTGGVTEADLADYLCLDSVLAVGGSWMVAPALLRAADFGEILRLTTRAVAAAGQGSG